MSVSVLPGYDDSAPRVRRELLEAVMATPRERWPSLVFVARPDAPVEVMTRAALDAYFRVNGLAELRRELRSKAPPKLGILVWAESEGDCGFAYAKIPAFLPDLSKRPACFR